MNFDESCLIQCHSIVQSGLAQDRQSHVSNLLHCKHAGLLELFTFQVVQVLSILAFKLAKLRYLPIILVVSVFVSLSVSFVK